MGLIPNLRSWNLLNTSTFELLVGQFEPVGMTKEISINWATHTALNRQLPILQFLNRNSETFSFQGTFHARDILFNDVEDDLIQLESWTFNAEPEGRPPVLHFWVGDGHLSRDVVLQSISGITYSRPTFFGGVKMVTFTLNMIEYNEFSLDDTGSFDTRFHRSKTRDYYELLTAREYSNPLLGDVIRKRHPTQPVIQVGDIVKLPSVEGVRREKVTQTSIQLATAYGKRLMPQKQLRLDMFDLRARPFVSHVIVED